MVTPRTVMKLHRVERADLGERGRSHRVARRHSQRELVEGAGITAAYLSRIETGERRPSVDVLEQLARRLRVDVDEVL